MNIAMFTNAYPPHVGGVASSVSRTVAALKKLGHSILVVAPDYGQEGDSDPKGVIRLQSIKNVSGSDFSIPFPFSMELREELSSFSPDIIHSHYPLLVGDMALRYGALEQIPVVFTHHTRYEAYGDLLPWDVEGFESFITELSAGYANLCSRVLVPTKGMVGLLRNSGVKTPISVIPTGVDLLQFSEGTGARVRRKYGIDSGAFVAGYIGRLAPEKNLDFWSQAVCEFLEKHPGSHAMVVGEGKCATRIMKSFERRKLSGRLTMTGTLKGQSLVDAYHAADVFAFASTRETQGLVLVEALASGCPVVALDAPCVRDVISDGEDGYLVKSHSPRSFADALGEFANMNSMHYDNICKKATENAQRFDINACTRKTLRLYSELTNDRRPGVMEITGWLALGELAGREIKLWKNRFQALAGALLEKRAKKDSESSGQG